MPTRSHEPLRPTRHPSPALPGRPHPASPRRRKGAAAPRENRLKNRDLWDIAWLVQQGIVLPTDLIPHKIHDHQRGITEFANLLTCRTESLTADPKVRVDFLHEMRRFLPVAIVRDTLGIPAWWTYLAQVIADQSRLALHAIR